MTQRVIERDFIDAPRIELAIAPDDKGANVNAPSTLFDLWLVMHMPGEERSMGVVISGGPFDLMGAQKRLFEIWTSLSKEAERM
jgi:hypothetical protein